ncbi:MAG: hypothetical protein IJ339_01050 [Oscillospiraceae bacterium]|nr:hypothetical protein [Oscillospiraceae bacterium]
MNKQVSSLVALPCAKPHTPRRTVWSKPIDETLLFIRRAPLSIPPLGNIT